MNSRREFREIVKTCGEGSTLQPLFPNAFGALRLFILLLLLTNNVFSQNIQNQQYDLNDPRNPDCPCHKLQKLADDEYNKIKNNKIKNNDIQQQFASNLDVTISNKNNLDNTINQSDNNFNPKQNNFNQIDNIGNDNSSRQAKNIFIANKREVSAEIGGSGSRAKKSKSGLWLRKKINRTKLKNSRLKKIKTNYSVCYKW